MLASLMITIAHLPPQQLEPDRASAVRLHHHELAWQAAGKSSGDRATDRRHRHRHRHRDRPQSLLRDRWKLVSEESRGAQPDEEIHAIIITRDKFRGDRTNTITPNQ
jgi:hypothetical protein